ncbi:MAG TPA: PQQ-binding-like beta-propeller repeat protein [Phycisphaerae bacterium]|nr:PQQ-binding-like beta-propeller repeat protein [Phycisphaerae bacterium]
MTCVSQCVTAALATLILAAPCAADPIVGWRGDGSGLYPQAHPPASWDTDDGENILWQTEIGKGQSSPIVSGDRVFVTVEPDRLLCLEKKTGRILWTKESGYAALPAGTKVPEKGLPTAAGCGYSTPTPVTDGRLVYTSHGTGVVAAYDFEGKREWIRFIDRPPESEYGRSASPVLAGGKLLVSIGGLFALDPKTGNVLWQTLEVHPLFGTPIVVKVGDTDVIFTPSGEAVRLADGKVLAKKLAMAKYTSPVAADGVVYYAGPPAIALKLPARADEPFKPERLWENEDLEGEYFASPILHGGLLYCVSNSGVLLALDAKTGKIAWQKEIEIGSQSGMPGVESANVYPSLTLAGKYFLLGNDVGQTLVLEPGKQYKEVARGIIGKGSAACPAPEGNLLFLRGALKLCCIGAK